MPTQEDIQSSSYAAKYNPLSTMRTYSYHHILLAARDTQTVNNLLRNTDMDVYLHPDQKGKGYRFSAQSSSPNSPHDYVVIINGMTDVQFAIDSVKLESFIIPEMSNNPNVARSSIAAGVTGSVSITEMYGARLIEVMSTAAKDIGVQLISMPFILKTVFVGHGYDGKPVVVSGVKPLYFMITNISCVFSNIGTQYSFDIAPLENGVGNEPAMATVGQANKFKTAGTVKDAITAFFGAIHRVQEGQRTKTTTGDASTVIEYDFEFVKPTNPLTQGYDSDMYKIDQLTSASRDGDSFYMEVPTGDTIPQGIERILQASSKVLEEMKTVRTEDGSYTPKWFPQIKSEVFYERDGRRRILYRIGKREVVVTPPMEDACSEKAGATNQERNNAILKLVDASKRSGDLLEFDYMFTGKNTEVLDFEMKADIGFLAPVNQVVQPLPVGQTSMTQGDTPVSTVQTKAPSNGTCAISPMPLPTNKFGTSLVASSTSQFRENIRQQSQFNTTEVKMQIRGNPRLFSGVLSTDPSDPNFGTSASDSSDSSWLPVPSLVKVNVFTPKIDPATGMPDPIRFGVLNKETGDRLTASFWYDGLFSVYQVNSTFEGGQFTQDLIMMSITPADGTPTSSTVDTSTTPGASPAGTPKAKDSRGTNTIQNQRRTTGVQKSLNGNQLKAITLNNYADAIRQMESGGSSNLGVVNSYGYLGLFQMGWGALVDSGMINRSPGKRPYSWKRVEFTWNGRLHTCASEQDFLTSEAAQYYAFTMFTKRMWGYVESVRGYIGTRVGGVLVTASGLLAAAHLGGHASIKQFLRSDGKVMVVDANNMPIVNYLIAAANKDVSAYGVPASFVQKTAGQPTGQYDWSLKPAIKLAGT